MLAVDVADVTAAHLTPLAPVLTAPRLPGVDGVPDWAWHVLNYPGGFLIVPEPRLIGPGPHIARWYVTVQVGARTAQEARALAGQVQARLHGTPRNFTGFEYQGDVGSGFVRDGFKITLSFALTRRLKE
ncbi:hypothetical protein DM785_02670 [Deinococcus actinosclerus]|nr:hypothetical protein DM785_02670 [Deinococcus actinosclerus]